MDEVTVTPRDPRRLAEFVGRERTAALVGAMADEARAALGGASIVNVNSTAVGGGVAEMLPVLLGYARGVGIDARWFVIAGDPDFFTVTKRVHNRLYGGAGDGGPLGEAEADVYDRAMRANAAELAVHVRPGDVVILHDPQTAGLARHARQLGCEVVWRCHVGVDEPNEHTEQGWRFLRPHLEGHVRHYVFTHRVFAPAWIDQDDITSIWPSIDPFAPKNQPMAADRVEAILTQVGLLAGQAGDTAFERSDGTPGRVEHYCDIVRTGPAPGPDVPMVVQVSRWDGMKDMAGVMAGFAEHVDSGRAAHLVLAGPVVTAVADDPEGAQVLQAVWAQWRQLPHAVRHRIQIACLPMQDLEENAAIVNALQRHATVVVQKSLAEGFGLTVAEGMLKSRPVVASAVGGIVDQVVDGETGFLLDDPTDLATFGSRVAELLDDPALARRMGEAGRRCAVELHLGDSHLERWLGVLDKLRR
jgi:trehalose synthase